MEEINQIITATNATTTNTTATVENDTETANIIEQIEGFKNIDTTISIYPPTYLCS